MIYDEFTKHRTTVSTTTRFLIIALLFWLFSMPPNLQGAPSDPAPKTVNLHEVEFSEAVSALSAAYDMEIQVLENRPDTIITVELKNRSLELALKRLFAISRVESYALIYEGDNILKIWCAPPGNPEDYNPSDVPDKATPLGADDSPLSQHQMLMLAQEDDAWTSANEEFLEITTEELKQLQDENDEFSAIEEQRTEPLTQDQMQTLKREAAFIKENIETEGTRQKLSIDQMRQLKQFEEANGGYIEKDREKPLTREKMMLLEQEAETAEARRH